MEELIDEEVGEIEEDKAITTFPRLKYLTIVHLPKLVKISSCVLDFPHLPKVHLMDCPNLKRLPFKPDIINNQGLLIKCEKKWWEILEWDDATIQSQFCSNSTEEEEIAEFFDEAVGMIGICGMGGVGKTTLLKKINQSLLDDANMGFNHVLFIEASKDIQLKELRKKNAKGLQLEPFAGKEDIFNVLKSSNFVLLLDNIWEEMCATMGAEEMIIKVECLEPDEAWDLYKDNVIESNENFKKIAWQMMRKCGGLPLALKVNSAKKSGTEIVQGVQESLLPILKFSYDNLPRNIQECFLCASILRWLYKDDLLELWMGLGIIGDFVNLQQAYDKAEYILEILEESCLLYFSDDSGVHLHKVIYEMATWIASDYRRNMNKWIVKSYDWFAVEKPSINAENWIFASRVIISGEVELLPILSQQCYDLLCLMIRNSHNLINIPEGFFRQMPNLIYLYLSGTGIKELAKDIKHLANLQCLNISFTWISSLPRSWHI
ncbi:disease resistance protein SUMM2-like [Dioscorea cayenensis subsp. rotundata]|uniref:Disease resistance protein SUMM2-like n=1 Tax=Dioscorea cayennensis subsp. rotundata TaxID=55577 RepID=A0AB40AUI8_DIOCR|nr:disease resistance protein SUMM2-like [Dioscorea cayenensis subsp. rotundata]